MSTTVVSFVVRKLNRTKAALLMLEARHIGARPQDGVCPICLPVGVVWSDAEPVCSTITSLRSEVAAGELALKQAIRDERAACSAPARGSR